MKQFKFWLAAILLGSLFTMAGCGNDDDDSAGNVTDDRNSDTVSFTVTPALGKVQNANVRILAEDGITELASGIVGPDGSITFENIEHDSAAVIQVTGGANAIYYDEASLTMLGFGEDQSIHALVSNLEGHVSVTPITDIAYHRAQALNMFPLTPTAVQTLNEQVRLGVVPSISSVLLVPTVFDVNTTTGSLDNSEAGKYALYLASLTVLGSGNVTPAFAVSEALSADLKDGDLDGFNQEGGVLTPWVDFVTQWNTALIAASGVYGDAELQQAAPTMVPSTIVVGDDLDNNSNIDDMAWSLGVTGTVTTIEGEFIFDPLSFDGVAPPDFANTQLVQNFVASQLAFIGAIDNFQVSMADQQQDKATLQTSFMADFQGQPNAVYELTFAWVK